MADGPNETSTELRALFIGPATIELDGERFTVTDLQARLLGELAIAAPDSLGVDLLLARLWPDTRPSSARASLYNQFSRLRKRISEDLIDSDQGAYRLTASTDIDLVRDALQRLEGLIAYHHYGQAELLAQRALNRFRGTPFAELGNDPHVENLRREIAEAKRSITTLRVEAAVGAGRVGWAVPEAERLVAETPTDEHRWALLIEALRQSGRRGDALAAYDRARRTLVDRLGLEPGPELVAANTRVHGSGASATTSTAGALIGREEFIAQLVASIDEHPYSFIMGEHGSGKSRLLTVFANRLARSGMQVALVSCAGHPSSAAAVLHEVADELGVPIPANTPMPDAFVDAIRSAVASSEGRVVILLDDVSYLGPTSLAGLIACGAIRGVTLIGADRPSVIIPDDLNLHLIPIPALTQAQVALMLQDRTGRKPDSRQSQWAWEMSGGNPAFVELLASDIPEFDDDDPNDPGPLAATIQVGSLVRSRLSRLSQGARMVLELAAINGAPMPASMILALAPTTGLDEAIVSGLLVRNQNGTVEFRHGAVRSVVYADIAPGRRAEFHGLLGQVLEERGATATQIAPHAYAARTIDPHRAARMTTAAANEAGDDTAHRDAADWFDKAHEAALLLGPAGAELAVNALIGRGNELRRRGDVAANEALNVAVDAAFELGDAGLIARSAFARLRVGGESRAGAADDATLGLIQRALKVATRPDDRALVLGGAAFALSMTDRAEEARAFAHEAADLPSSDAERVLILGSIDLALWLPDDLDLRVRLETELGRIAARTGDRFDRMEQLQYSIATNLMRCNGATARQAAAELADATSLIRDRAVRFATGCYLVAIQFVDGELDSIEQSADELLDLMTPVAPDWAMLTYTSIIIQLRFAQGREIELSPLLEELMSSQPAVAVWKATYALASIDADAVRSAELALDAVTDPARDFLWAATVLFAGRVGVRLGDRQICERVIELFTPFSGHAVWTGTGVCGLVDTLLADAHLVLDDFTAAANALIGARAQAAALGAPVFSSELDSVSARLAVALTRYDPEGAVPLNRPSFFSRPL